MKKIIAGFAPQAPTPPTTPGGVNTDVQFNDAGSFGGTNDLTFDKATKILSTNTIRLADGTAASPSISFTSKTNTGIYHDVPTFGDRSVCISCNGLVSAVFSTNSFRLRTIGGSDQLIIGTLAGRIDVPLNGGISIWSNSLQAGSGTVVAALTYQYVLTKPLTVATLPAASAALRGARAYVNDSLAPTFGGIVIGGGTVDSPVYCDGTNWRVG